MTAVEVPADLLDVARRDPDGGASRIAYYEATQRARRVAGRFGFVVHAAMVARADSTTGTLPYDPERIARLTGCGARTVRAVLAVGERADLWTVDVERGVIELHGAPS